MSNKPRLFSYKELTCKNRLRFRSGKYDSGWGDPDLFVECGESVLRRELKTRYIDQENGRFEQVASDPEKFIWRCETCSQALDLRNK